MKKPDILFIMCDQLRYDAIAAHGNNRILTPNLDKLVNEGYSFSKAYSDCPVCVPARYSLMSGCMPYTDGVYSNHVRKNEIRERCGEYLATQMSKAGYRTFGIGKFHTSPFDEDLGFDVQLRSEEIWGTLKHRNEQDDYVKFLNENHPEYSHIEQPHGERTNMYYMPQTRAYPQSCCVENWLTEHAKEQLAIEDERPYFGFLSFIQPHPPFTPPVPYNRMYNPDDMQNPIETDKDIDFLDEQITYMNKEIWAEDINNFHVRMLKSRYYGEISYIDDCVGEILDAVKKRGNLDNTVIFFFADHGDHFGDHHAWQKESFFDQSAKIPFVVFCGKNIEGKPQGSLASLTDLFATATGLAGAEETRDGVNLFKEKRDHVSGVYGEPGTRLFKAMIRDEKYKYIAMSNGGTELLFDMEADPNETKPLKDEALLAKMRKMLADELSSKPETAEMIENGKLKAYSFEERPIKRVKQFDHANGIKDFTINFKD